MVLFRLGFDLARWGAAGVVFDEPFDVWDLVHDSVPFVPLNHRLDLGRLMARHDGEAIVFCSDGVVLPLVDRWPPAAR